MLPSGGRAFKGGHYLAGLVLHSDVDSVTDFP